VVAVILGYFFAGEQLGAREGAAMLLIVAAVILIALPQWRRQAP
jgi:drug/metabolite transporter (DMT)-like permease